MNKLKKEREGAGLTQVQLAARSGVSLRMIQHYEQGFKDLSKAQARTLKRLAEALEVPMENLIE